MRIVARRVEGYAHDVEILTVEMHAERKGWVLAGEARVNVVERLEPA